MTEEEFKSFMTKMNGNTNRVINMCEDTSTKSLGAKWLSQGYNLTPERIDLLAKELRKKISVSISLVVSGIGTPEDVIDDLK